MSELRHVLNTPMRDDWRALALLVGFLVLLVAAAALYAWRPWRRS